MKKGFTLIELLAVIVILAIIALISTPIIVGLIDNAKKNAFENTAYGIIKAGEMGYTDDILKGNVSETTFTYVNGVESSDPVGKMLKYNGKKPQNGTVVVNNKGEIAIAIHDGTYCVKKGFAENEVVLTKRVKESCTIGALEPTPPEGELANSLNDVDGDGYLDIWYFEQLAYISTNATTLGQNYELMRGLNFQDNGDYLDGGTNKPLWTTSNGWMPITVFTGEFNGNNYTIENLYINRSSSEIGLFGRTYEATLRNVRLKNATAEGNTSVGTLAGAVEEESLVENCSSTNVSVKTKSWGDTEAGGLIGSLYMKSDVIKCFATGNVVGDSRTGILIGGSYLYNYIYDSYAIGTAQGTSGTGGLVGYHQTSNIRRSYAAVSINKAAPTNVGALVGYTNSFSSYVVLDSFWDSGVYVTSPEGTGFTKLQMQNSANYTNWDFTTVWNAPHPDINNGYPTLRGFEYDVEINSLGSAYVDDNRINISWTKPTHSNYSSVNLYIDGSKVVTKQDISSYSATVDATVQHTFKITTVDIDGKESYGQTIKYNPPSNTITKVYPVQSNTENGYINSAGTFIVSPSSITLGSLGADKYSMFARFTNVDIPQGATIVSAHLEYFITNTYTVKSDIYFSNESNPTIIASYADFMARPKTTNTVLWDANPGDYKVAISPNISAIIQEIVNRGDWVSGNAMLLLNLNNASTSSFYRWSVHSATGYYTYEEIPPTLIIEYEL